MVGFTIRGEVVSAVSGERNGAKGTGPEVLSLPPTLSHSAYLRPHSEWGRTPEVRSRNRPGPRLVARPAFGFQSRKEAGGAPAGGAASVAASVRRRSRPPVRTGLAPLIVKDVARTLNVRLPDRTDATPPSALSL